MHHCCAHKIILVVKNVAWVLGIIIHIKCFLRCLANTLLRDKVVVSIEVGKWESHFGPIANNLGSDPYIYSIKLLRKPTANQVININTQIKIDKLRAYHFIIHKRIG